MNTSHILHNKLIHIINVLKSSVAKVITTACSCFTLFSCRLPVSFWSTSLKKMCMTGYINKDNHDNRLAIPYPIPHTIYEGVSKSF